MSLEKRESSATLRRDASFVRAGARRAPRVGPGVDERARELVTMAAHDLRAPLSALKMIAARAIRRWQAGREPTGSEWADAVLAMSRTADDAFGLIDDLLAIERLAQHHGPARMQPAVDVEALVEEAIAHHSDILERARCRITVVRQKGLSQACGAWDRGYLLRVLSNLLRNVARHAPGAPVEISLSRRRGNRLGIVFADHGPGLRKRPAASVDDRADDTLADAASHGLGLWIVHRAVERLNGRLRMGDTPGGGVAFDIELPGLAP